MPGQAGTSIAADLFRKRLPGTAVLVPKTLDTLAADTESFADLASALAAFARGNNSLSEVLA